MADAPARSPVQLLLADPPWTFGDRLPGPSRGASRNYNTMASSDIAAFPLPPLADDALLFMWRVAALQCEALDVVKAWGFDLKSELVWLKRTAIGKRWFGMGRYVRMEHETCLIATRGRGLGLIRGHSVRSTFEGTVREHSAKPDEFYALLDELCGTDIVRHEMFARRVRPGWCQEGNELGSLVP